MLDQNTDRMWYVIGAVIIGAAIILLLNKTFPQLFASVGETFGNKVDDTALIVKDIGKTKPGGEEATDGVGPLDPKAKNLIELSDILVRYDIEADLSSYTRDNSLVLMKTGAPNSGVAGIQLRAQDLGLKPNTTYVLAYDYQKINGELLSFGGHSDLDTYKNNTVVVDGKTVGVPYHNTNSVFVKNDTAVHTVRVYFTTPSVISEHINNDGIWIQPNRGRVELVAVRLTNLKMIEVK